VEDVGCGGFAAGALPGYLVAYGLFHARNSNYQQLSTHQKFLQRSVFSPDILNKVNIHYSSKFPPGFGSAAATTMGSEIYIRAAKANLDFVPTWNLTLTPAFVQQVQLLNHEMGHSKQYAARGWSISSFGYKYLFEYCKAGFSYSKNSMEKDAETYRAKSNALMGGLARAHFKKWRKDNLIWAAGYSTSAAEYSNFNIGGKKIFSIDLTKTTGKLAESQRKDGTACVRVLWGTSLNSRTKAEIAGKPWDCVTQRPTKAPTRKPTPPPPTPPPQFQISDTKVPLGFVPTPKPTPQPQFKISGTRLPGLRPTPKIRPQINLAAFRPTPAVQIPR